MGWSTGWSKKAGPPSERRAHASSLTKGPNIHSSIWGWPGVKLSMRKGLVWSAVPEPRHRAIEVVRGVPMGKPRAPANRPPHLPSRRSLARTPHRCDDLWVAQNEETRAVQLVAVQVKRRNVGGQQVSSSLIKHHNVAVQCRFGLSKSSQIPAVGTVLLSASTSLMKTSWADVRDGKSTGRAQSRERESWMQVAQRLESARK